MSRVLSFPAAVGGVTCGPKSAVVCPRIYSAFEPENVLLNATGEPERCSGAAYIHTQARTGVFTSSLIAVKPSPGDVSAGYGCQFSFNRSWSREFHNSRATWWLRFNHPVSCVCGTRYRHYKNCQIRMCVPVTQSEISGNNSHVAPKKAMDILTNNANIHFIYNCL